VGLLDSRRDIGNRQRHCEVAHSRQDRRHPDSSGATGHAVLTPNPLLAQDPIRSRASSSVEPPVEILLPPPRLGPSSGDQYLPPTNTNHSPDAQDTAGYIR
jgi:hypothetical protein